MKIVAQQFVYYSVQLQFVYTWITFGKMLIVTQTHTMLW